jgi:hypothetical protein
MSKPPSVFRHFRLLAIALALPTFAAAVPAQANVRTTIAGASCMPDPFWVRDSNGSFDVFTNGAIKWHTHTPDANSSFSMFCPLTRSLPLTTDGLSDLEVRFKPTTADASQPSCTASSVRPDGTILVAQTLDQTIPGTTPSTMNFGDAIDRSTSKGTYFLRCLLPLTVQLVSVYHSEVDGINGN